MVAKRETRVGHAAWSVDQIPYEAVEPARMRDETELFFITASASFIEITSDLYTQNLITFYDGDDEIVDWLANYWEREEVQHGHALKRYVEAAWPDFDWETAYRGFFDEYSQLCKVESLAENRSLEMVARCVVETGTASFYRALSQASPCPVLKQIAANISADEVRHYKYFYRYFLHYRDRERPSRFQILRQLWHRGAGVKAEDAYIAFKHTFAVRYPEKSFADADFHEFRSSLRRIGQNAFPYEMAVKMILKPLGLSPPLGRVVQPTLEYTTRLLLLR